MSWSIFLQVLGVEIKASQVILSFKQIRHFRCLDFKPEFSGSQFSALSSLDPYHWVETLCSYLYLVISKNTVTDFDQWGRYHIPPCQQAAIKKAYIKMALKLHPDKNSDKKVCLSWLSIERDYPAYSLQQEAPDLFQLQIVISTSSVGMTLLLHVWTAFWP